MPVNSNFYQALEQTLLINFLIFPSFFLHMYSNPMKIQDELRPGFRLILCFEKDYYESASLPTAMRGGVAKFL